MKATTIQFFRVTLDLNVLNEAVKESAEKFYESVELESQFTLFDEYDSEDITNEMGGMSL